LLRHVWSSSGIERWNAGDGQSLCDGQSFGNAESDPQASIRARAQTGDQAGEVFGRETLLVHHADKPRHELDRVVVRRVPQLFRKDMAPFRIVESQTCQPSGGIQR
jgi:hypothetical protein